MSYCLILALLIFTSFTQIHATLSTVKVKYIPQSRFIPPIDLHLIDTVNNTRSATACAIICDRHVVCRTADYNSNTKQCRLFKSLASAGDYVFDAMTTVLPLDYCRDDNRIEPEYICVRSGTYSVQEMFNRLRVARNITLPSTDRGVYANMHGVYSTSAGGVLSFVNYAGVATTLATVGTELTNINSATRNGVATVRYSTSEAVIHTNQGTPTAPNLVQARLISLPGQPYAACANNQHVYVSYAASYTLTIHDLLTGALLLGSAAFPFGTFRPVITLWKDRLTMVDQYVVRDYNLTGGYLGPWPYFSGFQSGRRHYMHHDYAGRRYICNDGGTNPGVYAFLLNGTQLGQGASSCARAVQIYISKDQAVFANALPTYMQVINW